ncbi:MAG: hypothetical protein IT578_07570 [Verrucomicrobiae bacterium]|nr:hypothetical protein [Verrucomicrobiae bacterium]
MLTILLVAFVGSVRVERLSTKAFSDQLKARLAAQMAVEQALVDLRGVMPESSPEYTTTVMTNSQFTTPTNFYVYVSTNVYSPVFSTDPRDLSIPASYWQNGAAMKALGLTYATPQISSVKVPWIYYTNSFAGTGAVSSLRGIVRYAYWADDESSKINVNSTSVTNKASYGDFSPSRYDLSGVDLRGLILVGEGRGQAIVNERTSPKSPYETVSALGRVQTGGGINYTNLYLEGIAYFATVWSAEAERQTNGRVRVNINDGNFTTGVLAGVAVTNLVTTLGREAPGISNKFGAAIWQLAANLHDQLTPSDRIPTDSETDSWKKPVYLGIKNVPYLNEFQLRSEVAASIVDSNFVFAVTNTATWEVFNLWQTSYAWSSNTLLLRTLPSITLVLPGVLNTNLPGGPTTLQIMTNLNMGNYTYATFSTQTVHMVKVDTNYVGTLSVTFNDSGTLTNIWGRLLPGGSVARFDWAELPGRTPSNPNIPLSVPMSAQAVSNVLSCSVKSPGDPRVNDNPADWSTGAASTPGSQNGGYSPAAAGGDGNSTTDLAAGQDGGFPFIEGPFPSAGFLGVVSYTNAWMTLKMYGDGYSNHNGSARVPDWSLLDVFTANPVTPGERTVGKINVNTLREVCANPQKEGGLAALFMDVPINASGGSLGYNTSALQTVVTNVMAGVPYSSIGDLASRAGCFTNPPSLNADTDWRREAVIRAIANNVTVRGGQFSIWALGQNISIVRGRTNVLGEAMAQAVVDRVEATDATRVTGVTWRVRFFRFLNE